MFGEQLRHQALAAAVPQGPAERSPELPVADRFVGDVLEDPAQLGLEDLGTAAKTRREVLLQDGQQQVVRRLAHWQHPLVALGKTIAYARQQSLRQRLHGIGDACPLTPSG